MNHFLDKKATCLKHYQGRQPYKEAGSKAYRDFHDNISQACLIQSYCLVSIVQWSAGKTFKDSQRKKPPKKHVSFTLKGYFF